MEENKQSNTLKTVLLIFGIIFSVILVPGLILGIPVGGAAVALSQSVSQEGIERIVKEAKLSDKAYQLVMDEVLKETQNDDTLNADFFEGMLRECITVETVDEIVIAFIDCMYNGTEPQIKFDNVLEGFRNGIEDISENGFEDFYSACFEGAESKYFSEVFIQSSKETIEQEIISKYSAYGVSSLEELETVYDAQFGAGAYAKLFDEEIAEFERGWNEGMLDGFDDEIDDLAEELEIEVNQALAEAVRDPDVRTMFDTLNEISEKKDTVKIVAYAIVLAAVLLLLVCYWFGTAGFVVPSVALILGGLLCKLVTLLEGPVLSVIRDEIAADPDAAEFGDIVMDICRGIIAPFFAEMSKFGVTMIGIGVLLILAAILRGVIKKNTAVADDVM